MGAGKSTAINALLDEARLLPTSGYDAYTSVATEVRFNHSLDSAEAYRAEIMFITEDELLNSSSTAQVAARHRQDHQWPMTMTTVRPKSHGIRSMQCVSSTLFSFYASSSAFFFSTSPEYIAFGPLASEEHILHREAGLPRPQIA